MDISEHLQNKVHQRILELFENGHNNDDILNLNIKKPILDKLLPYQILHVFNMITAVKNNMVSIDSSYTGTGKTYTTIATCAQLGLVPFVICPKSIVSVWRNVISTFGIDCVTVVNYEAIRSMKYDDKDIKGRKIDCPYIKKKDSGFEWDFSTHPKKDKIVFIFDEVHRCKNSKSLNGRLLLSCKNKKTIMLSATLCDKKEDFGIFGLMLGFYNRQSQGKNWIESVVREDKNKIGKKRTNSLHKYLFPEKGSRMALEDLDKTFPMNQISVECHNLDRDSTIKINRFYKQMVKEQSTMIDKNKLTQITEIRQKIENYKVDTMFDLVLNYLEQDKSVVVFVNYLSTHDLITKLLKDKDIGYAEITGRQTDEERQDCINSFQNNEVRVIVCMNQAGGSTISLHDVTGRFPRISIISPSFSRIELMQILGRIYRSGCKSPCLQKIILCADTYEENIARILTSKKETLDKLTDEDLDVSKYIDLNDESKSKKIIKNSII